LLIDYNGKDGRILEDPCICCARTGGARRDTQRSSQHVAESSRTCECGGQSLVANRGWLEDTYSLVRACHLGGIDSRSATRHCRTQGAAPPQRLGHPNALHRIRRLVCHTDGPWSSRFKPYESHSSVPTAPGLIGHRDTLVAHSMRWQHKGESLSISIQTPPSAKTSGSATVVSRSSISRMTPCASFN
jgi:hypothetical protein